MVEQQLSNLGHHLVRGAGHVVLIEDLQPIMLVSTDSAFKRIVGASTCVTVQQKRQAWNRAFQGLTSAASTCASCPPRRRACLVLDRAPPSSSSSGVLAVASRCPQPPAANATQPPSQRGPPPPCIASPPHQLPLLPHARPPRGASCVVLGQPRETSAHHSAGDSGRRSNTKTSTRAQCRGRSAPRRLQHIVADPRWSPSFVDASHALGAERVHGCAQSGRGHASLLA